MVTEEQAKQIVTSKITEEQNKMEQSIDGLYNGIRLAALCELVLALEILDQNQIEEIEKKVSLTPRTKFGF